jgi:hypothetical protein
MNIDERTAGHELLKIGTLVDFEISGLRFYADYIRGRSMKTDITVRSDGTVRLTTWGRGEAALRWLDRLKGKKLMELV